MKPEPPNPTWKVGETCLGSHDCPDPLYPMHHTSRCTCTAKSLDECKTCHALVCTTCKQTVF